MLQQKKCDACMHSHMLNSSFSSFTVNNLKKLWLLGQCFSLNPVVFLACVSPHTPFCMGALHPLFSPVLQSMCVFYYQQLCYLLFWQHYRSMMYVRPGEGASSKHSLSHSFTFECSLINCMTPSQVVEDENTHTHQHTLLLLLSSESSSACRCCE